jgi:hypothetical protein
LKKVGENIFLVESIVKVVDKESWSYSLNQSALMIFKSLYSLDYFNYRVELSNLFPKKLIFLTYIEKIPDISDLLLLPMPIVLSPDSGHISLYQYFLVRNDSKMLLLTLEWFSDLYCNDVVGERVDEFDLATRKWKLKLQNKFDKFKNFKGCLLVTGSDHGASEGAHIYEYDNITRGYLVDLFKIISEIGNFTVYHQLIALTADSKLALYNVDDMVLYINIFPELKSIAMPTYHVTSIFKQVDMIFVISSSETYSNYEKMTMPFDKLTWRLLLVTFLIAFTVIFTVNRMPLIIQNIIYGVGIKMPAFNMIGTFFGISQSRLPSSNFPRMVLVFFIYFCLIFRTAYQGVFYDMFTANISKPSISTIKQLYENNFKIVALNKDAYIQPLYTFTDTKIV